MRSCVKPAAASQKLPTFSTRRPENRRLVIAHCDPRAAARDLPDSQGSAFKRQIRPSAGVLCALFVSSVDLRFDTTVIALEEKPIGQQQNVSRPNSGSAIVSGFLFGHAVDRFDSGGGQHRFPFRAETVCRGSTAAH